MSQTLLIALAVSLPLAGLAWLAAVAVEVSGAGLKLRLHAWAAAFLLPLAVAPVMLAIHGADLHSRLAWSPNGPAQAPARAIPALAVAAVTLTPSQAVAALDTPPITARISPAAILLSLLAIGAALRLTGLVVSLRRVDRLAAKSQPLEAALSDRLGQRVRQVETDTPILAGLIKPVILLPRALLDQLSIDQAALVCAHERAHLAAGDHLSHVLEEVMVRLFWFNPLLALIRERLAATREEACDARALAICDATDRRTYAQALITALTLAGEAQPVAAFTGFRAKGARRRFSAILKPSGKGSPVAWVAAALAGLGLTGMLGGVSLALAAEPPAPPAPPASTPVPADAPPAAAAPSTPPAQARPHHHTVITIQESGGDDAEGGPTDQTAPKTKSWVFDDGAFAGFANLDPAHMPQLTQEDRDRIAKAMEQARAAAAQARAAGQAAAAQARVAGQLAATEGRKRAEEARAQVEQSLKAWRAAGAPAADGKVLMRCSVKPDGSPSDCQKVANRVMILPPPLPPLPPVPPAPPLPPLSTPS